MRLTELLGRRVVDAAGKDIGGVADVRLVQDGPLQPSMQNAFRVDGLIVVERRSTQLFGYERHVGPALLRWLVHRRLGNVWYLPWTDVERIVDGAVETRSGRADLRPLEDFARY
jgi:sporulation protein YlmC with PRC-barrel domain